MDMQWYSILYKPRIGFVCKPERDGEAKRTMAKRAVSTNISGDKARFLLLKI